MSNRSTRREALAAITLADLPAPREITFRYDGAVYQGAGVWAARTDAGRGVNVVLIRRFPVRGGR